MRFVWNLPSKIEGVQFWRSLELLRWYVGVNGCLLMSKAMWQVGIMYNTLTDDFFDDIDFYEFEKNIYLDFSGYNLCVEINKTINSLSKDLILVFSRLIRVAISMLLFFITRNRFVIFYLPISFCIHAREKLWHSCSFDILPIHHLAIYN